PLLALRQHKPEPGDDVADAELEVLRRRVAGNVGRRHADRGGDPAGALDKQEALRIDRQGEEDVLRDGWRETGIRKCREQFLGPSPGAHLAVVLTADTAHDEI